MKETLEEIIPRGVLENVCVTALEGGSNYWYHLSDDTYKAIRKAVPKNEDPYLSSAILKAVLDHNVDVPINDCENEDEVVGIISIKTLSERLKKLSLNEGCSWALTQELEGNGDAESSDVVFQFITMGEVVYG